MGLLAKGPIEQAAWDRLNYSIYVPPEGFDLLTVLGEQGAERFIMELGTRADLGTTWAAAILGFLELKGGLSGQARLDRAEQRCLPAARAGDSYAQYVLAWILLELRRPEEAFQWMNRAAAVGNFLPAWADLGRFTLGGVGLRHPSVARGIDILWSAHRRGHQAALLFICDTYRRGRCGLARRAVGYLMSPYALIRFYFALLLHPFTERVFVNMHTGERPFRSVAPTSGRASSGS